MAEPPSIDDRLARLSRLEPEDGEAIRALSAEILGLDLSDTGCALAKKKVPTAR